MDSIDAQCLVMDLVMREISAPELWRHEGSGSLSCCYRDGESTFTWPREDVAAMARRWRASHAEPPESLKAMRDAHERLCAILAEGGLPRADAVVHDVPAGELHAVWTDRKLVVVIDGIGPEAHQDALSASS